MTKLKLWVMLWVGETFSLEVGENQSDVIDTLGITYSCEGLIFLTNVLHVHIFHKVIGINYYIECHTGVNKIIHIQKMNIDG